MVEFLTREAVNGVQYLCRDTSKVIELKERQMRIVSLLGMVGLTDSTACDVSHPVAVVGPGQTVFRGTATATFLEGGWFQASNGTTSCQGHYRPASEARTVTFPVTCSNGLTGVGTATYETPRAGGGDIAMQDGTRWKFIFGRAALAV